MAEKNSPDHLADAGGTPPEGSPPPTPPLPTPYIFDFKNPKVDHSKYTPGFHEDFIAIPEDRDLRISANEYDRVKRVKKKERARIRREECPEILRSEMQSPKSLNDKQLKNAVYRIIDDNLETAAQKIVDLMDCEDKRVALHAATALLDRRFGKPEQMRKVESMNLTKTVVVIRDESDDDDVIDITPTKEGE